MDTIETLIRARALIEHDSNWTKGVLVRKAGENRCYCALGAVLQIEAPGLAEAYNMDAGSDDEAVEAAWRHVRESETVKVLALAVDNRGYNCVSVYSFNDSYDVGHADVLQLYDRAISRLRPAHVQV